MTKEHTQLWQVTWMVYIQWNGEGGTVVVRHADSRLPLNRNVTVYGCRYEYGYGYGLRQQYVRMSIQVQLLV